MPRMNKAYAHSLGREAATKRIKEAIERELVAKANVISNVRQNWTDDYHLDYSLNVFTYPVSGHMEVTDETVDLQIDLPVVAMMVMGMVDSQLSQQMNEFLA